MDNITPVGKDVTVEEKLVLKDMDMIIIVPENKNIITEICPCCNGKGSFDELFDEKGACFTCLGKGKLTYKNKEESQ